jgi:phytoene dehydrogenase-like protein
MASEIFDVVIAGGGVNALACAAVLARERRLSRCAWSERNPWVGGCAITREATIPGFRHDMYRIVPRLDSRECRF